ncbi:RTA1 domain containing protein [Pyrenophora teres f. maculata]|nr:RTA1 domain containing protein [Pyrenophora teres f. maculata]
MIIGYNNAHCYIPSWDCPIEYSYWRYRPSFSTNATFTALFGLSMLLFLVQGIIGKRWVAFSIAMVSGCALEVVGYLGRILASQDMFNENPFLIQIICLTIGPAFLAAGIYLCLARIVTTVGPEHSRIKPLSYPRIFIPCDVVSLILQALGGGMASVATHNQEDPKTGNRIMIAGLGFQVATLLLFIAIAVDFAWRTYSGRTHLGQVPPNQQQTMLRRSWPFNAFLIALSISTLCIFTRCVFRVAELSEGWLGHLATTQKYFIGLEGAVIVASVLLLNLCHPDMCFKDAIDARVVQPSQRTWYGKTRGTGMVFNGGDESHTELVGFNNRDGKYRA